MKKIKTEKGITLVALIITIVVLLILATVAIGAVKNSDIIGYAKDASSSFEEAKDNEYAKLSSAEDLLAEVTGGEQAIVYDDSHQSYFEAIEYEMDDGTISYGYILKSEYAYRYSEETDEWIEGNKISEVPSKLIIPKQIDGVSVEEIAAISIVNPNISHLCIPDTSAEIYMTATAEILRISSETGEKVKIDFETMGGDFYQRLKKIEFDDNIIKLDCFFYGNKGLETIKFPSNLKEIESYFTHCIALSTIKIPKTIINIINHSEYQGDAIFGGGTKSNSLEVIYNGTKEEWNTMLLNNRKTKIFKDESITVHCIDGDIVV